MYKILENLATYGLGEPSELSGYVDCEIGLIDDFRIIDVRVLLSLILHHHHLNINSIS